MKKDLFTLAGDHEILTETLAGAFELLKEASNDDLRKLNLVMFTLEKLIQDMEQITKELYLAGRVTSNKEQFINAVFER